MGGLRAKDSKPKKVNDFKKVKTKVGKKVNRGPVTVIKVKSKKIIMSVQKSLQEKSGDEISQITLMTRQFHHHSASNRLIALTGVKDLLENSDNAESYIALVLPAAMELLFDEEKDTRKALLVFVDSLTKKYSKAAFESIASVISTYCCSGLTSLKKDVRHDALALLLQFLKNRTGSIFIHDIEKLLQHVASLLSLQSHNQKADTSDASLSGTGTTTASKKGGNQQGPGRKGTDKNNHIEKSASFLVSTLEVLEALIKLASTSSSALSRAATEHLNQSAAAPEEATKGTLLIYPLKRFSVITTVSKASASGSGSQGASSSSGGGSHDSTASLRSILDDVCSRLTPIWSGLVYEGSVISKHSLGPLCLISRVGVILSELIPCLDSVITAESARVVVQTEIFDLFLASFFSGFPYVLFESTIAQPGSKAEMEAKHLAGMLNTAVSEAALLWCKHSQGTKLLRAGDEGYGRVMKSSKAGAKFSAALALESEHLESTMSYVRTSLTFWNDSLSNKALSPAALMTDDWDDHLQRLFHCISLEVLFLSEKSSVRDSEQEVHSVDEEAIGHILSDLCMLISFSVDALSSLTFSVANSGLIDRLTFILKSSVTCAAHITASENLLWETTNSRALSKIILLTQTLSLLPKRLVGICQKSASSSSLPRDDASLSDCEYVVFSALSTLLLLLRRCADPSEGGVSDCCSMEDEEEEEEDTMQIQSTPSASAVMWDSILSQVSAQVADLFKEHEDAGSNTDPDNSVFTLYSNPIRMILLDIWYYCRFENFEEVAADSIVAVTGTRIVTSVEQEKMLHLLFLRRNEMSVDAFLSSLMRGVETSVGLVCDEFIERSSVSDSGDRDREGDEELLLALAEHVNRSDWCVHKIASTLHRCGSSSSPHYIAAFVLPLLRDLVMETDHEYTDLYCYSLGALSVLRSLLSSFVSTSASLIIRDDVANASAAVDEASDGAEVSVLHLATELSADIVVKLLLCHASSGKDRARGTTSALWRLGFRLLREGDPLVESLLCPILDGLVTKWSSHTGTSREHSMTRAGSSFTFSVFLKVLDKIGTRISLFQPEEIDSVTGNLFEIVQFWKLSESRCFDEYKTSLVESLTQWQLQKNVLACDKAKESIADFILFVNM